MMTSMSRPTPGTNKESASGFRSDAAPEMDAFLRQRGMQRGGVQLTQVLLAPVPTKSVALTHATSALRSDARSSHARTSNASWIKAYQKLLRHLRRQDHRARQHGAPVGSRQAMIHASNRRLFHRPCLTRNTRSTTLKTLSSSALQKAWNTRYKQLHTGRRNSTWRTRPGASTTAGCG